MAAREVFGNFSTFITAAGQPSGKSFVHTGVPLSLFRGHSIAVDMHRFLRNRVSPRARDPHSAALCAPGPLPAAALVDADFGALASAGVAPVPVFGGLTPPRQGERTISSSAHLHSKRVAGAWRALRAAPSQPQPSAEAFAEASDRSVVSAAFSAALMRRLVARGVDCVRAPYMTWPEVAWVALSRCNGVAWGGCELALLGVARVVLDVDAAAGTCTVLDTAELLRFLNIEADRLIDAALLSGSEYCPALSALNVGSLFGSALRIVKEYGSGRDAILALSSEEHTERIPTHYLDTFLRARTFLLHHPVFTSDCACVPFSAAVDQLSLSPEDLHVFFGPRLPPELYFFICIGAVGLQVVHSLIAGVMADLPPIADTEEHQDLLGQLVNMRARTLGILSSALHPDLRKIKVDVLRLDEQGHTVPTPLNHSTIPPPADFKPFSDNDIDKELARQQRPADLSSIDLSMLISMYSARFASGEGPIKPITGPTLSPITSLRSALAYVLLQGLIYMDHIIPGKGPTTVAKVLEQSFRAPGSLDMQEQTIICLELMRAELLSGAPLHPLPHEDAVWEDSTPAVVRLLTRTFSLVPMNFVPGKAWDGPIDFDLAAFHAIASALSRSLGNLHEMLFVSLSLRRKIAVSPADSVALASHLPFGQMPSVALGAVLKDFLTSTPGSPLPKVTAAADLTADLRVGYKFWEHIVAMARLMAASNLIYPEALSEFEEAHKLICSRFKSVSLL